MKNLFGIKKRDQALNLVNKKLASPCWCPYMEMLVKFFFKKIAA